MAAGKIQLCRGKKYAENEFWGNKNFLTKNVRNGLFLTANKKGIDLL